MLEKIKFYSCLRFSIRWFANMAIPIYFLVTKDNKRYLIANNDKNERRIIISLTSYPARINRLWIVVETILRQTKKPDKIILWLSQKQYTSINVLPAKLLDQRSRGLEIRIMEGDIRSHKKYFYTLQEFPDDIMITVDDDIFYRSTMIENMHHYSLIYPGSVIAQYCREMIWTKEHLESYTSWPVIKEEKSPNLNSFFGSGGGTLFPAKSMNFSVLESKLFMSLTPTADDVWLNAMCRLNQTSIVKTAYYGNNLPVINWSDVTLDSINNGQKQNDIQIHAVREHFIQGNGLDPFRKI